MKNNFDFKIFCKDLGMDNFNFILVINFKSLLLLVIFVISIYHMSSIVKSCYAELSEIVLNRGIFANLVSLNYKI